MGMTKSEANQMFDEFLEQCKMESESEGTANLPQNYGDILISKESSDNNAKALLKRLREEGVKDSDIKWWWNMHELERRMMKRDDDWTRQTMFLNYMNVKKLNSNDAEKRLNKKTPLYGVPNMKNESIGDDDPLPFELKDRINIYITALADSGYQNFLNESAEYSTLNAFLRAKIKEGEI